MVLVRFGKAAATSGFPNEGKFYFGSQVSQGTNPAGPAARPAPTADEQKKKPPLRDEQRRSCQSSFVFTRAVSDSRLVGEHFAHIAMRVMGSLQSL